MTAHRDVSFFSASIPTPADIPMHELFMPKFDQFNLSRTEKRKLCINTRKILHCHDLLESKQMKTWAKNFVKKIESSQEDKIVIKTSGAGVYLVLAAMELYPSLSKKVICYTSEIPLKMAKTKCSPSKSWKFVFRGDPKSFLGDFPGLWKHSPYLSLFEQIPRKKAA